MGLNLAVFIAAMVLSISTLVTMDGIIGLVRASHDHARRDVRMVITAIIIAGAAISILVMALSWGAWGSESLWLLGAIPASLLVIADMRSKA